MATLYAQTSSGRVYIDDFDKGVHDDPSCFTCDGRLVAKKGQLKTHHFAHRSKEECDAWNDSGMTEWHKNWQLLVPEECREVRMTRDGKTHIADIQLPTGEVVEIQHSPITVDEVYKRETFYDNMVWIVDGVDVVTMHQRKGHVALFRGGKKWWFRSAKVVYVDTRWGIYKLGCNVNYTSAAIWFGISPQSRASTDDYAALSRPYSMDNIHPVRAFTNVREWLRRLPIISSLQHSPLDTTLNYSRYRELNNMYQYEMQKKMADNDSIFNKGSIMMFLC